MFTTIRLLTLVTVSSYHSSYLFLFVVKKPLISDFSQRNDGKDPNSIYTDYPPYPDPYLETYRSYSTWNMAKARHNDG